MIKLSTKIVPTFPPLYIITIIICFIPQDIELSVLGELQGGLVTEASGIAASRLNPDVLWTHNDSDGLNRIFAFNRQGKNLGIFYLANIVARDWEDLAIGPGPVKGVSYLYVAEIGDNDAQYPEKYIYRFPEPYIDPSAGLIVDTIKTIETITFRFPDSVRDAETLLLDPLNLDLYVISKREKNVHVYLAPHDQSLDSTITLTLVGNLSFRNATSGEFSPDGQHLLIKTYDNVFHWKRNPSEPLIQILSAAPDTLPYVIEPQGEAICWSPNGKGYYTISEEKDSLPVNLNFYNFNIR